MEITVYVAISCRLRNSKPVFITYHLFGFWPHAQCLGNVRTSAMPIGFERSV